MAHIQFLSLNVREQHTHQPILIYITGASQYEFKAGYMKSYETMDLDIATYKKKF
jgi:hypothetical protein